MEENQVAIDTQELRQNRAKLIEDARKILDKAEEEKRDLSAEEHEQYGRMIADVTKIAERIQREEHLRGLEADLEKSQRPPINQGAGGDGDGEPLSRRATPEYQAAFNRFIRSGPGALSEVERRALQADDDTLGGYLVAPEQFVRQLIKAVDDAVIIRGLATVIPVAAAQTLGVPSLDTDPADADWTSEIATGSEDTAMAFGKRELHPHPLAKRIKVSNKLIRVAALNAEDIVRNRLAYKFGITQEKAFMTGSGSNQPLGLFTASADGISTARDVSAGNTTTSIQTDGLLKAKYALKAQYWPRARWIFHRDAMEQIHSLKDGEGRYILQPDFQGGPADRILRFPALMSEYAPNTVTTGLYVGMVGDFSNYWIADA
ncbi:MAG: phage major capsid protein, partial [Candidatus Tectimicrobiota bacterium]